MRQLLELLEDARVCSRSSLTRYKSVKFFTRVCLYTLVKIFTLSNAQKTLERHNKLFRSISGAQNACVDAQNARVSFWSRHWALRTLALTLRTLESLLQHCLEHLLFYFIMKNRDEMLIIFNNLRTISTFFLDFGQFYKTYT